MKHTLLFLALTTSAFSQVKISELPAASALGGTEVAVIVQGATTKKATAAQFATYVNDLGAALFQPLFATGTGAIVNNGSNSWSYLGTTTGNNGASDAGKLVLYNTNGALAARAAVQCFSSDGTTNTSLVSNGLSGLKGGNFVGLTWPASVTSAWTWALPSGGGTLAPLNSPTFTGTVVIPSGASIDGYVTTATANSTYALATQVSSSVWVGAGEFIPRSTNGAGVNSSETSTHKRNYDTLDFDAGATEEGGDVLLVLPDNYAGGTITVTFYWTADSGSGTVIWKCAARSFENDTALDTATGTAQSSTDTLITAGDMHISPATSAITIAGSPAARTPIGFTVTRDSATDTLAVDARLIGIEINY